MKVASPHKTAILLFSRTAGEEAVVKRFGRGIDRRRDRQVAATLIQHTTQLVSTSGFPILTATHQQGNSFGERLHHALSEGFAQGYEHIIAIGNDCPNLQVEHLHKAHQLLEQTDLVLGPATDGGVYLIGLGKATFENLPFQHLPWQTSQLFSTLLHSALSLGISHAWMATLSDIDTSEDLEIFLNQDNGSSTLGRKLQALLAPAKASFFYKNPPSSTSPLYFHQQRPPPVLVD